MNIKWGLFEETKRRSRIEGGGERMWSKYIVCMYKTHNEPHEEL
jgi:hypothetical protein